MDRTFGLKEQNLLQSACHQLRLWDQQGVHLPGYVYERGTPYLAYLLGLDLPDDRSEYYKDAFLSMYVAGGHSLMEQLTGPHGLTVLKATLVKVKHRDNRERRRKLLRKLRRQAKQVAAQQDYFYE